MSDSNDAEETDVSLEMADPIPLTTAQELVVRRLITKVDEAKMELALDRQAREADKSLARRNNILTWTILALLAFMAVGALGFTVSYVNDQNQKRQDDREFAIGNCARGNEFRALVNDLNEGTQNLGRGVLALSNALEGIIDLTNTSNPERTPEAQAALDQFIVQSHALIDSANNSVSNSIQSIQAALIEYRNCDPSVLFNSPSETSQ